MPFRFEFSQPQGTPGDSLRRIRHISLNEKNGVTQVIVPVYRTNQMGVMTLRSETELAAHKAQAQQ